VNTLAAPGTHTVMVTSLGLAAMAINRLVELEEPAEQQ
jgi:hypothetical protein